MGLHHYAAARLKPGAYFGTIPKQMFGLFFARLLIVIVPSILILVQFSAATAATPSKKFLSAPLMLRGQISNNAENSGVTVEQFLGIFGDNPWSWEALTNGKWKLERNEVDELTGQSNAILMQLNPTQGGVMVHRLIVGGRELDSQMMHDFQTTAIILYKVIEGRHLAGPARQAVYEYFVSHSKWPTDNAAAGIPMATSISANYVGSVMVQNGNIITTYNQPPLVNQTIIDKPAHTNSGTIKWDCTGGTVAREHRPMECR